LQENVLDMRRAKTEFHENTRILFFFNVRCTPTVFSVGKGLADMNARACMSGYAAQNSKL